MPQRPNLVTVTSWSGLIEAMKVRRAQLKLSQAEVGRRAGLQDGYYGKIEAWEGDSGRGIGPKTFARILAVLGLRLSVNVCEPVAGFDDVLGDVEARQRAIMLKKNFDETLATNSKLTHAEKCRLYRRMVALHPLTPRGSNVERVMLSRERHRERYNAYQRELMRRRREIRRQPSGHNPQA